MHPSMLSSGEMDVLADLLLHGDNTPGNISDNTGKHETTVSRALSDLEDKGLVSSKGRGVWTLTLRGAHMSQTVIRHREMTDGEDPPL